MTRLAWTHVGPEPIDIGALIARVSDPSTGGIATFIGTVREHSGGREVLGLEYEAYEAMATRELAAIVAEAMCGSEAVSVAVAHRTGKLAIGDVAVAIAAGHAHRAPAFDACRYVIEQIKVRLPVWKREQYADGSHEWVQPSNDQLAER